MSAPGDEYKVGLSRAKDETRMQDAWMVFVCGGVESLTHRLRRGDKFSLKALNDMQALQRRLGAFNDALDCRVPIVETDED